MESGLRRPPLSKVLIHELMRFLSREMGLVEPEPAGLAEGFAVDLVFGAVLLIVLRVDRTYCFPHLIKLLFGNGG